MSRTEMMVPMAISTCSSSSSTADSIPAPETAPTSKSEGDKGPRVMVVVPSFSSTEEMSSARKCVAYSCSSQNAASLSPPHRPREEVEMCWLSPRQDGALLASPSFEQRAFGPPSTLRHFPSFGVNQHSSYESYYDVKTDFTPSTWKEVLDYKSMPAFSMAVLATATIVVVHPLVFMAGAATAVWAVGVFHAVEQGYDFFSDGTFSRLFWEDKDPDDGSFNEKKSSMIVRSQTIETNATFSEISALKTKDKTASSTNCDFEKNANRSTAPLLSKFEPVSSTPETGTQPETKDENIATFRHESVGESSVSSSPCSTPTTTASIKKRMRHHFPELERQVIKEVKFPGLNVLDFFSVFFSDSAPYGMKEFQQTMGDIDLSYGKWMPVTDEERMIPILPRSTSKDHMDEDPTSLPKDVSVEQRVLTFKSLTKSYFGPAYASATKTQRVTKISKELLIVENYTQLSDIPYSDRFCVCERWVMEAIPNNELMAKVRTGSDRSLTSSSNQQTHDGYVRPPMSYTTVLTVDVEVKMLKKCPWEAQIRNKTLPSMEKVITSWCKMATTALEVTQKKKLERMHRKPAGDSKTTTEKAATTVRLTGVGQTCEHLDHAEDSCNETKQQRHLMALHHKRFREMEEKIASGDLEWCSIEVQHSNSSEQGSISTKVLDPYVFFSMGSNESAGGGGNRSRESRPENSERSNIVEQGDKREGSIDSPLSPLPLPDDKGHDSSTRTKRTSRFSRRNIRSRGSVLRLLSLRRKSPAMKPPAC